MVTVVLVLCLLGGLSMVFTDLTVVATVEEGLFHLFGDLLVVSV